MSSQRDLDGELEGIKIENASARPAHGFPLTMSAANYCAFRGMLMTSYTYTFKGKLGSACSKEEPPA